MTFCIQLGEASGDDRGPLSDQSGDEEVVANSPETILLHKRHQETKTNIDHDVNILEHCEKSPDHIGKNMRTERVSNKE